MEYPYCSLWRRFEFHLPFSYFLTTQTTIGPWQGLQSLARNIIAAGNTNAEGALSNSPECRFDHSNQTPTLAGLLEQRFLCDTADGLVARVLRRINFQRPCLACQPTEQPDSIFPPGLKLPPVLLNLCFFHSVHNYSSCATKTPSPLLAADLLRSLVGSDGLPEITANLFFTL